MKRTYNPWLAVAAAASTAAVAVGQPSSGDAISLFGSRPLDASRFAVLAKPVGTGDWSLLVLEQIQAAPRCWEQRPDGLIDPALNRFDFTGICSRYLDSNGYSLRVGDEDLASRYRLRLEQRGGSLALLAMTPSDSSEMLVGRGVVPLRDRNGFVQIQLESGWQLQRRVYGEQTLSHVYFANATPLAQLLGRTSETSDSPSALPQALGAPQPPISPRTLAAVPQGPIALQVIPFRP